jgi:NADH-quinone oxidoreductase subunit A
MRTGGIRILRLDSRYKGVKAVEFLLGLLCDKIHKVDFAAEFPLTAMADTLPVLLFIAAATALSVGLLAVGKLFGPKRNTAVKEMPYESGMDPIHDTRRRFDVRFHLVAIAFLVFDVELLFLYPWAVAVRNPAGIQSVVPGDGVAIPLVASRELIFTEALIFIALLAAGFVYAWRKGVFQWR